VIVASIVLFNKYPFLSITAVASTIQSMDGGAWVRLVLPLFVIGFVTTLFATLSVSGVISADGERIYLVFVYAILGIACAFLSYWRNAVVLSRVSFLIFALLDITCAIAAPCVSWAFHDYAHYLNRVIYFMFLEIALLGSLALFWHHATGIFGSAYLEQAGVDAAQESFLYVVWSVIVGFIVVWFIPLKSSYDRSVIFNAAVVNTVGWWFFGGLLAAGFGILIAVKGGTSRATPGVGSSKDTSYEQVT
jgi:hypothetical protein